MERNVLRSDFAHTYTVVQLIDESDDISAKRESNRLDSAKKDCSQAVMCLLANLCVSCLEELRPSIRKIPGYAGSVNTTSPLNPLSGPVPADCIQNSHGIVVVQESPLCIFQPLVFSFPACPVLRGL